MTDTEVHVTCGEYGAVMIHANLMPLQHNMSDQISIFPGVLFPVLVSTLCVGDSVKAGEELNIYPHVYINRES